MGSTRYFEVTDKPLVNKLIELDESSAELLDAANRKIKRKYKAKQLFWNTLDGEVMGCIFEENKLPEGDEWVKVSSKFEERLYRKPRAGKKGDKIREFLKSLKVVTSYDYKRLLNVSSFHGFGYCSIPRGKNKGFWYGVNEGNLFPYEEDTSLVKRICDMDWEEAFKKMKAFEARSNPRSKGTK